MLGKDTYVEHVLGSGKERPWRPISLRQDLCAPGPVVDLSHLPGGDPHGGASEAGRVPPLLLALPRALPVTYPVELVLQRLGLRVKPVRNEIWPVLERYTERVADPSRWSADARAARVFFSTGVSPG